MMELGFTYGLSSVMDFLLEFLGNILAWFPGWKYKGGWIVIAIISIVLLIAVVSIILMW